METVRTYEKRPDRVQAAQWDGTVEGVEAVSNLLREHYSRGPLLTLHVEHTAEKDDQPIWVQLRHGGRQEHLRPSYWLVYSRSEGFTVMSNDEFEYLYDVPQKEQANG